jgi:hypothetical protein
MNPLFVPWALTRDQVKTHKSKLVVSMDLIVLLQSGPLQRMAHLLQQTVDVNCFAAAVLAVARYPWNNFQVVRNPTGIRLDVSE